MPNPFNNKINLTITENDLESITSALQTVLNLLAAYSHTLTEKERNSMFNLKDANRVFSKDTLMQGQVLYNQLPEEVQTLVTNLETDLNIFSQFDSLQKGILAQINRRIGDTRRIGAHESFSTALALYKYFGTGAKAGLDGYMAAFKALEKRFQPPAKPGARQHESP